MWHLCTIMITKQFIIIHQFSRRSLYDLADNAGDAVDAAAAADDDEANAYMLEYNVLSFSATIEFSVISLLVISMSS